MVGFYAVAFSNHTCQGFRFFTMPKGKNNNKKKKRKTSIYVVEEIKCTTTAGSRFWEVGSLLWLETLFIKYLCTQGHRGGRKAASLPISGEALPSPEAGYTIASNQFSLGKKPARSCVKKLPSMKADVCRILVMCRPFSYHFIYLSQRHLMTHCMRVRDSKKGRIVILVTYAIAKQKKERTVHIKMQPLPTKPHSNKS